MKYDEYINYLCAILNTGIENEKLAEGNKKIFSSLDSLFTSIKPPASDKKATDAYNNNRKKITTSIESVYTACKVSPFIKKTNNTITVSENELKVSGNLPESLPLIIAGPLVRKVEPDAVTIWVALKAENEKKITLEIFEDNNGNAGELLLSAKDVSPVKLGASLFIAAATAKPTGSKKLEYGKSYLYNLKFEAAGDLKSLTSGLTYPGYSLPSFMLPPLDVNKIHIIHSSCRNMSNEAYDAMPALDTLMEKEWTKNRPQQLFLSGDQVYADEGNEILEYLYINTGNVLMGGQPGADKKYKSPEKMRTKENAVPDACPAEIVPGERGNMHETKDYSFKGGSKSLYELLKAHANVTVEIRDYIHDDCGFTPTSRIHVFSLADFFGLYLLNWSDQLWPAFYRNIACRDWAVKLANANKNDEENNLLSKLTEAKEQLKSIAESCLSNDKEKFDTAPPDKKKALVLLAYELFRFRLVIINLIEMVHTIIFASELPKVRRALANISTYMIFDDHEITDDWHMTREWVHRTYSMPMGRRVLQNGLAAFAVFSRHGVIRRSDLIKTQQQAENC